MSTPPETPDSEDSSARSAQPSEEVAETEPRSDRQVDAEETPDAQPSEEAVETEPRSDRQVDAEETPDAQPSEEAVETEPRSDRQVDAEETPDDRSRGAKRGKLVGSLVTFALVVLLSGGAMFGWNVWKSGSVGDLKDMISGVDGVDLAEGDCVDIPRKGAQGEFERAGCGSAGSDYRVVELREDSQKCVEQSYDALIANENVYCMVPDVKVGDCVDNLDNDSKSTLLTKVDCAAGTAKWKVTVVADVADSEECAVGNIYLTYSDPARTLCFAELSRS